MIKKKEKIITSYDVKNVIKKGLKDINFYGTIRIKKITLK
jgi:hypothetical protein